MPPQLPPRSALILVDVQRDFFPGGALAVQPRPRLVKVLNDWIAAAERAGSPVVASRDWHPADHASFDVHGGRWPVHCVQTTSGAEFRAELELPSDVHVVNKGVERRDESYSAFEGTDLANWIAAQGIESVWIGGVALDVCVLATALDALRAGLETHIITEGVSPVTEEGGQKALAELAAEGAHLD